MSLHLAETLPDGRPRCHYVGPAMGVNRDWRNPSRYQCLNAATSVEHDPAIECCCGDPDCRDGYWPAVDVPVCDGPHQWPPDRTPQQREQLARLKKAMTKEDD